VHDGFLSSGVKPGDQWCLCSQRWAQAYNAGAAPQLYLAATHERTLEHVPLKFLLPFAIDKVEAKAYLARVDALRKQLGGASVTQDDGDK